MASRCVAAVCAMLCVVRTCEGTSTGRSLTTGNGTQVSPKPSCCLAVRSNKTSTISMCDFCAVADGRLRYEVRTVRAGPRDAKTNAPRRLQTVHSRCEAFQLNSLGPRVSVQA